MNKKTVGFYTYRSKYQSAALPTELHLQYIIYNLWRWTDSNRRRTENFKFLYYANIQRNFQKASLVLS